MPSPAAHDTPLHGVDDLLAPFQAAEKPRELWRIGTEAEKFGITASGGPAPFEGGVAEILRRLAERRGWTAQREYADRPVIALKRGGASITLEPGAQLELSGAPLDTIHQTREEFGGHMAEVVAESRELGLRWITLGFRPFATQSDLPWVPKLRYGVMREYLPMTPLISPAFHFYTNLDNNWPEEALDANSIQSPYNPGAFRPHLTKAD